MLQMKTDKLLEESFHSKNMENYRQKQYLNMAARHKFITKNIVEGEIPGNLRGKSSGRLGGFHLLQNNNILLIYSRVKCDNGFGNKNETSELCFLTFNNELKIEKKIQMRHGNYINCIKHANYGNNIFIMISETTEVTEDKRYIYDKYTYFGEDIEEDHIPCNCFMVNENGEIISDLISFNFNFFSPNDDFKTLKDGSIVWTFVDDYDCLYLCFLPSKSLYNYFNKSQYDIINAGQFNDFLIMKKEKEEKKNRRKKEILKSMGFDVDLITKKIFENDSTEKERLIKELEEQLEKASKAVEEEEEKEEKEEKEEEEEKEEKEKEEKEKEEKEKEEKEKKKQD